MTVYLQISEWLNDNQGVVATAIFAITIGFAWLSGIFSALRRKPKFKLSLSGGPTFCCTYGIGTKYGEFEVHRTGVALYLGVANIGSAAASIERIWIGYHWHLRPFSMKWLRYTLGWHWLKTQSVALEDFQVRIGGSIKVYPFLMQKSFLSPVERKTYLQVGESTNGVVYFEQSDSYGGCFPTVRNGRVTIKVRAQDSFGRKYAAKFKIDSVEIDQARNYNPSFGKTLAELHGEPLPFDQPISKASAGSFNVDFKDAVIAKGPMNIDDAMAAAADVARSFLPYGISVSGKPHLVEAPIHLASTSMWNNSLRERKLKTRTPAKFFACLRDLPKIFERSMHVYEIRPHKDHRGFDLISDALPFGRLWYTEVPHAIGYAKFYNRSHHTMIRVYDDPGNVIQTHEHKGDFKEP